MNIKKISCSQFAGVRDRDITLTPGLNTIYGKNESGKSTLANMLSALFFQTVKLNRQRDRAFMDASFPSDGRNSPVTGDCIDGKVCFETPDGQYVLSKDWGSDARCTLSTPKGIIKDPSRIENTLASILPYGQGVYTNMLFSSQRNADETLRTILEASQGDELKQSLANAITQAFSETDGVSTDVIEQAILQKIADIEGKHWDRVLQMPKRKSERWQTSLGTILKSYYALEDANNALTEMEQLRQAAKSVETAYASQEKAAQTAEAEYKKFRRAYDNLVSKAAREQLIEKLREEQKRAQEAALKWPQAESEIARAKTLQWERDLQEKAAKYASVKKASDEVSSLKAAAEQAVCPSEEEVKLAKDIEKVILRLESQLRGVSFSITTKPLGEHTVSIRSLCSGAPLDISAPIEEAIVLTIPGVMEICLAPAGVDTEVVSKELQNKKSSLETLLTEYRAKSADGLAQMRRDALDAQAKLDAASERLRLVLGDADFDTLKAAAQVCATSPRSIQDIDRDIRALSSSGDLTRLIAVDESLLSRYVTEYTTQVNLKEKLEQLATNLEKAESDLAKLGEIPAEYADIKNPDMYLAMLESKAKEQQKLKEAAAQAKVAAQTKLESRRVSVAGKNLTAERDQAEQEFAAQKELLAHWNHILEVFQSQKAAQASHPMEDMAARFSENLKAITGGTVDSESANKDAVDVAVYSQDRRVRYSTLSEGTKEAVSLAFRLAVLDHLFPNGGGVIIFDDPMTNMDTDRAAAACKLLKEAGTRHQIIFLTCREEYLPMLAGHEIRVEG